MNVNNSTASSITSLIGKNKMDYQKELQKIAAAKAIDSTDGASMQIFDELTSQANTYSQGIKNANDAIGYLQIADGVTQGLTAGTDRLNELSAQYNSGILSQDNKNMIVAESNKIKESMNQMVESASFNGKKIFGSEASFYTGSSSQSVSIASPSISKLDVTNQDSIDSFRKELSALKSTIGSSVNALNSTINNNLNSMLTASSAASQIGDTDFGQAVNSMSSSSLKLNFATMSLAHNNSYLATKIEGLLR